jgi:RNA polymerase sigma factor (sigma-70 family)
VFQQQLDTKNTQTPPKYKKKGKQFSRYDPLDHEILTPDQEKILGRKIQRANALKTKINGVLETKKALREKQLRAEERFISSALYGEYYDEEDFADLTVYNSREEALEEFERDSYSTMASSYTMESDTEEDTVLFEQDGDDNNDLLSSGSSPFEGLVDSGNSILSEATLSDAEIASLGVSGGRDKLYKILLEGALARDKMIRSNIRLVVSIAKKWARDTAGGMMGDGISSILYEGSSSRPSLDEAIQEGILGLAKAADRFDPERGFKFGTYATWWITNHVRKTYNSAITGSIRVPPNYHIVRQKYKKQVNAYRREHDREPAFDDVASEMGIKPERLRFILQSTQTIVSLDAPLGPGNWVGGGQAYVNNDGNAPSIKDTIEW